MPLRCAPISDGYLAEIESAITVPDITCKLIEEVNKYASEYEAVTDDFQKSLIFAVNDFPHTSRADSSHRYVHQDLTLDYTHEYN